MLMSNFFNLHKNIANKKKLKILSFGIDNQNANIKLISIKKISNKFKATIRVNNSKLIFIFLIIFKDTYLQYSGCSSCNEYFF